MKLFYKLSLLLVSMQVSASQIHIYVQDINQHQSAQIVKDIFVDSYKVPQQLIKISYSSRCLGQDKRFLELCIDQVGELTAISNKQHFRIKKSLLTFSANVDSHVN